MKKKLNLLTSAQMEKLQSQHEVLSFKNDFDLVYEMQIPNGGVALLEGFIELTKNHTSHEFLPPGCLLGVHHILNEEPVSYGCKIKKNSKIIILGKSEILESVRNKRSSLFQILKNYF